MEKQQALSKWRKISNVTYQLEEDEGEGAGNEAHERNPHDHLEDVVFVEGLVLRDLDLLVQQEGPAEGVHHDDGLERAHTHALDQHQRD